MLHFVTLFDHRYLLKGLALHASLTRHGGDWRLWVVALDEQAVALLTQLDLDRVRIVPLPELEDAALLRVKPDRTRVAYYWTLTPSLPRFVFAHDATAEQVCYIDADCYFFAPVAELLADWGPAATYIHEHRYSPAYAGHQGESGRFNVGIVGFRRDPDGLAAMEWWRERCLEWCHEYYEDGKLGDQMYLNAFPDRFQRVRIAAHPGVGVAPWNVKNYRVSGAAGTPMVDDRPVVLAHFHSFRHYGHGRFDPAPAYFPTGAEMRCLYRPYARELDRLQARVAAVAAHPEEMLSALPPWPRRLRRTASIWKHRLLSAVTQEVAK